MTYRLSHLHLIVDILAVAVMTEKLINQEVKRENQRMALL